MKKLTPLLVLVACTEIQAPESTKKPEIAFAVAPSLANVTYCYQGAIPLKMDVYKPKPLLNNRVPLIFIHGGAWLGGDKTSDTGTADIGKLKNAGYTTFFPNYTVGVGSFPEHLEDLKCVVRHIRANAVQYGINPEKIGCWGHSAGAHLCALLAVMDSGRYEGNGGFPDFSSKIQAAVTYAGPFDLTDSLTLADSTNAYIERVFGTQIDSANVLNYVTVDDPPFLIFHGTLDESIFYGHQNSLIDALNNVGVPVKFIPIINGGHYLLVPSKYKFTYVASPTRPAISDSVVVFFNQLRK